MKNIFCFVRTRAPKGSVLIVVLEHLVLDKPNILVPLLERVIVSMSNNNAIILYIIFIAVFGALKLQANDIQGCLLTF